MRTAYQEQLAALMAQLNQMCEMAGVAMQGACEGLLRADIRRAESVILGQEEITALSFRAEEIAFSLLALQAPVATDLRAVVSALQIAAD
ncbi:MAG: phosphate transport system regulatory protein PhoU, partial [Mycobacterium sp.]|nr:phosphate transport system regulatory protein PhoU [Mycobacterium sp.]